MCLRSSLSNKTNLRAHLRSLWLGFSHPTPHGLGCGVSEQDGDTPGNWGQFCGDTLAAKINSFYFSLQSNWMGNTIWGFKRWWGFKALCFQVGSPQILEFLLALSCIFPCSELGFQFSSWENPIFLPARPQPVPRVLCDPGSLPAGFGGFFPSVGPWGTLRCQPATTFTAAHLRSLIPLSGIILTGFWCHWERICGDHPGSVWDNALPVLVWFGERCPLPSAFTAEWSWVVTQGVQHVWFVPGSPDLCQ